MLDTPHQSVVTTGMRGRVSYVTLQGELDLATGSLLPLVTELAAGAHVVLDLSAISFVDLAGVRAIMELADLMGDDQRYLEIIAPPGQVARVFDLAGADLMLPPAPDVSEAGAAVPALRLVVADAEETCP